MLKVAEKYLLAFPEKCVDEIVGELEKAGCFEIEQIEQVRHSEEKQNIDYLLVGADFAIDFLKPLSKEKKSFFAKLKTPFLLVKKDVLSETVKKSEFTKIAERVVQIDKESDIRKSKLKEIVKSLADVACFGDLSFKPRDTENFALFLTAVGTINSENFFVGLRKQGFYFNQLSVQQNKTYVLLIALKEKREKMVSLLKDYKAEIVPYNFPDPPNQVRERLLEEEQRIKNELAGLEKESVDLAVCLNDLKVYRDGLALEKAFFDAKTKQKQGDFLQYIVFWSLSENVDVLKQNLRQIEKEISIANLKLREKEEPPVVLANNKTLRPFEYVTEIFGSPKANELDPTPYLWFFFILFFGICITDAAYGIIMALFCGLTLLIFKERFGDNKLIKLLFYGGISTALIGVLFGSYFGAGPEKFGLGFLNKLKLIDPFNDTLLFLGVAFGLGFLQLFFAQIIKIIAGKKAKNKLLSLSGAAWAGVYIFALLLGLGYFKYEFFKTIGFGGLIVFGAGLLLVESSGVKIFLKPLVGGIKILQGLIGAVSDILSYSRLMALGLATAVIALIVNQIAFLFGEMVPKVGFLIAVPILIGGHLFNLGINALGGFIHSGRLQFVEFFPKFLEGGGRRLKPLKSELKYTKVIN